MNFSQRSLEPQPVTVWRSRKSLKTHQQPALGLRMRGLVAAVVAVVAALGVALAAFLSVGA